MNKLPSIITIYKNAINLYMNTYIQVLPFALLLGIVSYFYLHVSSKMSTPHVQLTSQDNFIILGTFIGYFLIYSLIFCIALFGMNQKYHQQPFDYEQAFKKGGPRIGQVLLAVLIMLIPIVIAALFLFLGLMLAIYIKSQLLTIGIYALFVIALLYVYIYLYASQVLIVAKAQNAWQGLKQSWKITHGHWWKTFFILVIFIILYALITFGLSKIIGELAQVLMTILFFSLGIALMIVYCDELEKASQ